MVITRIELDGFKTFKDFKLDVAPFQVVIGPNSAGKSNLFDALRLLSQLADDDLRSAFQNLRGADIELFTLLSNGQYADRMTLAVEMLVEREIHDSWGAKEEIRFTRLRYELEIVRRVDERGLERLYVDRELLKPIANRDDRWIQLSLKNIHFRRHIVNGRPPFISTELAGDTPTLILHQDKHPGRKRVEVERPERTLLSRVNNAEFPHAFAAREEMRAWKFLHLNPEKLRQPSPILSKPVLSSDGGNLPTTLARMQAEDPYLINDVSRDIANLVPGILHVSIESDDRYEYTLQVTTQDGRTFSSRVLSDGTLRLLALVTLKNDPEHRGVLCFEEPENGVHPFRLKNLVGLLSKIPTDFADPAQAEEPLRQLLINTHSPTLASQFLQLAAHRDDKTSPTGTGLSYAYVRTRISPDASMPLRVTRLTPVSASTQMKLDLGIDEAEAAYTMDQVIKFMDSAEAGEAIDVLKGNGLA